MDEESRPEDSPALNRDRLPERTGESSGVSPGELERVIRRAAELQFEHGTGPASEVVPEEEIFRIAEEVGLSRAVVRQALAEVRSETSEAMLPEGAALARRLFGPATVRASGVVSGDQEELEAAAAAYLRQREHLRRVHAHPGHSVWEATAGLVSTVQRTLDVGGRERELAKVRRVELVIDRLDEQRCLVVATADLGNLRTEHVAGWQLGLGLPGLTVAALLLVFAGIPGLVAAPFAAGGTVGGALWGSRRTYTQHRARIGAALRALIDHMQQASGGAEPDDASVRDAAGRRRNPPFF